MTPFFLSYKDRVEARLDELLSDHNVPQPLYDAMRYSALGGGKRIRGTLLTGITELFGGDMDTALDFACAVEMIHAYSLIHDDLPGMDDDVLRRGKPTNHVVYGVGQAILAGDGLLNTACEVLMRRIIKTGGTAAEAANEVMKGAGTCGMIGGQCMDLDNEKNPEANDEILRSIHYGKTACMFIYPIRASLLLCGRRDLLECGSSFGEAFGRMFQMTDDLLDIRGSAEKLGKSVGKDSDSGKLTFCSLYGVEKATEMTQAEYEKAIRAAKGLDKAANYLIELTEKVYTREN